MKNLLSIVLVLLSLVTLAQKPKYLYIKQYKSGKVVSIKKITLTADTIYVYKPSVVYKNKVVKVPQKVPVVETKIVEVVKVQPIDSAAVAAKFYPKNVVKNTIVLPEKQGAVSLTDTLERNQLVGRSFTAVVQPKMVEVVREVPAPKVREWYLGPELTTNFNTIYNWYGANVLLKNKANNIFKLGTGITMRTDNAGPTPYISLGAYIKVK